MKKLLFIILTLILCVNCAYSQDKRLAGIDTAVARILKEFNAVGVTVAVVEKNNVVLAKGFGYKDFENKTPITPNTLFQIGSSTKAFTCTLLGTLMDEKKLDLDKPVSEYIPELIFKDDYLTKHITTKDMMTHRTGLPRHDLAWYLRPNTTRKELIEAVRYFEPFAGLREKWYYNNFMFMMQGALAEKITGKTWETLLQERILTPLSMTGTKYTTADMEKSPDYSLGYGYDDKKKEVKKLDYYHFSGMEPAGSIASSAKDMTEWLKLWINVGKYNGKTLFSKAYYDQAIKTQMAIAAQPDKPEMNLFTNGYGYGWFIKSYKGHYHVEHGGNIDGFSTTAGFFPTDSIGIFVCVNQNGSQVQGAIRNWIADRLLNVEKTDWVTYLKPKKDEKKDEKKEEKSKDLAQKEGTKPSHTLSDYVGKYTEKGYGTITVFEKDSELRAIFGKDTSLLKHYHFDVFKLTSEKLEDDDEGGLKLMFTMNMDGDITHLEANLEAALKTTIKFVKEPTEIKVATSDLKKYEGNYEIAGMAVKVEERKGVLHMNVPGQPEYELSPSKTDEFKLKGVEGFSVRFDMQDGKVTAAYSIQPNGTFKMVKK